MFTGHLEYLMSELHPNMTEIIGKKNLNKSHNKND